jgi:hypothetical protein
MPIVWFAQVPLEMQKSENIGVELTRIQVLSESTAVSLQGARLEIVLRSEEDNQRDT